MELSVIIPCYEEDECLPLLFDRITEALGTTGLSYELVFVNDGSRDQTWQLIDEFARSGRAPRVVGVDFSRNYGKEAALLAGLSHATGEVVGIMDADLQQEPQTLLAMYGELMAHPEADCVAAYQSARHEGALKALLKGAFYRVFKDITQGTSGMIAGASDFRVFRRCVAEALLSMPEYHRFSKGLFAWVGFETIPFAYEPSPRAGGTTKWSLRKLMAYAIEGIFSFSTAPLKLATLVGSLSSLAAVVYFFVVVWEALATVRVPSGYPTIVCLILLLGGLILLTLGIIGEYVARIYLEGKRRPFSPAGSPPSSHFLRLKKFQTMTTAVAKSLVTVTMRAEVPRTATPAAMQASLMTRPAAESTMKTTNSRLRLMSARCVKT